MYARVFTPSAPRTTMSPSRGEVGRATLGSDWSARIGSPKVPGICCSSLAVYTSRAICWRASP